MKSALRLLAVAAVLGLAGTVLAARGEGAKNKPEAPKALRGMVVKVEGANLVIKTRSRTEKEPKEVTVATDDKTEVIIEGNPAKLADLKADQFVTITPETGVAAKIEVVKHTGRHEKKPAPPPPPPAE